MSDEVLLRTPSGPRAQREELDEAADDARRKRALRPIGPRELPLFLEGYLERFQLTERCKELATDGENIVFVGLRDYWDEPGAPFCPLDDLGIGRTTRLARALTIAFRDAARRGLLNEVTRARGKDRQLLVAHLGLEEVA